MDNPISGSLTSLNLRKFDIVLMSLSYEFDYINAIKILLLNNIPVVNDRGRRPIIIAGGPAVSANPLPLSKFFDGIVIGEGEEVLKLLMDSTGLLHSKDLFLENLASKGLYIPLLHDGSKIKKSYVVDLDSSYYPEYQIQSLIIEPVFGRGYIMEISRGCKHLCSFCMEAFISYPYRVRSYEKIMESVGKGLEVNKVDRVVFYSLSFFDHHSADRILETLLERGIRFSIPSVRADTLNEYRVDLIRRGGQKTLTLAPETHSDKLRCVIRKYISDELVSRLIDYGIKLGMEIKLYYMIGIPFEDDEDINQLVKFLRGLIPILDKSRFRRRVRVVINPLIPKANTPMQFFGLINKKEYMHRVRLIRKGLPGRYFRVEALSHNLAYIQATMSLGDVKLGDVLLRYVSEAYVNEELHFLNYKYLLKSLGIDTDYVLKPRNPSEILPWEFIDLGLNIRGFNIIK